MLVPSFTEPSLGIAFAANRIASARLVLPAPAGPTSAMTFEPLPVAFMSLSLRFAAMPIEGDGAPESRGSTQRRAKARASMAGPRQDLHTDEHEPKNEIRRAACRERGCEYG